jgi:hypothetical protein
MGTDYEIGLRKGILEPKHFQQMGGAVWLYVWFVDHMTKIKGKQGFVLGGKPIIFNEIKLDLGLSRRTYCRYLDILEKYEYIGTKRTPYGLVVHVTNARKTFKKSDAPKEAQPRSNEDVPEMAQPMDKSGTSVGDSGTSNKRLKQYEIKTVDSSIQTNRKEIEECYKAICGVFKTDALATERRLEIIEEVIRKGRTSGQIIDGAKLLFAEKGIKPYWNDKTGGFMLDVFLGVSMGKTSLDGRLTRIDGYISKAMEGASVKKQRIHF